MVLVSGRLAAQRVEGSEFTTPTEVVTWMLALQGQDLPGAKWSVGLRAPGSTLADVDAVVVFSEKDVRALIREIRPDFHAKGTDYTVESVPERDEVEACGGRVVIVGDPKNHSVTEIIRSRSRLGPQPS